ncbi:hypothetical protein MAR_011066 [Mya arenaria]|uniref:Uncharacterized protein n=1 Tax=Mya arenaria TaxID=6604 RepID=A0ABY7FWC8_MYAAR|nr:uncharacterized protein LOC128217519 [Mya arenaria]WAR25362.1 hypothetical protein MAR_011066 [Mya arenaria]
MDFSLLLSRSRRVPKRFTDVIELKENGTPLCLDIQTMSIVGHQLNILPTAEAQNLREQFSRADSAHTFRSTGVVMYLVRTIPMIDVIILLILAGKETYVRMLLSKTFGLEGMYSVGQSDIPNAHRLPKYYFSMKSYLDSGVMGMESFQNMYQGFRSQIQQILAPGQTSNHGDLQWACDRLACIVFLRLQPMRDRGERRAILDEMDRSIPSDGSVDRTLVGIVYFGCLALSGDHTSPELSQIASTAERCSSGFIKAFTANITQFVYRRSLTFNVNDDHLLSHVICHCLSGMNCAKDGIDDEILKIHVLRSLMMNIVQSTLGIGFDLRVERSVPLEPKYRKTAKRYLQHVQRKLFEGIESRRSMIYWLCMARANDDKADGRSSQFLEEARLEAEDGAFFQTDLQNINTYGDFLPDNRGV